jgi:hypothetical protein
VRVTLTTSLTNVCQSSGRHIPGPHGARLDATMPLIVLQFALSRCAVAGEFFACGNQCRLVTLDVYQHVGLLFRRKR